ncbi:hypothetical protein [uncultured Ruegeria sp.]|uniref:hypothetical protein n=1 Tax=uncultured Ruegeria sp. TaxID=259304 RepID=UPI002618E2A8|nr:hypothetical protein [uncultured Ruegeria sp.]
MSVFRSIQLCASFILTGVSPAFPQDGKLPERLVIGENLDDLGKAGEVNGWGLSAGKWLPETWSVEGTDLALHFCGDVLWTIDQYLPGGLRAFVETVHNLEEKHGKPEIDVDIIPIPPKLYLVQSDFHTNDGLGITVQFFQKNDEST